MTDPAAFCVQKGKRLLLVVGAAHALVALAGVAVAVRAHVDGVELTVVLAAVMTAGRHGAVNGLIHTNSSIFVILERLLGDSVPAAGRSMRIF